MTKAARNADGDGLKAGAHSCVLAGIDKGVWPSLNGVVETLDLLPGTQTIRLDLQVLRREDAGTLHEIIDPVAIEAIDFLSEGFSQADTEKLIVGNQDGQDRFVGAWLRDESVLAAVVGTHLRANDEIEIGYWVNARLRGRGIASEAVKGVLEMLLALYPARTIVAECRPENMISWHLLEKIGFKSIGEPGKRLGRQRLVLNKPA